MIIPWVKIQWISDEVGYGLFARQFIPKGTITFVQDGLDIVIPDSQLENVPENLKEYVKKYSFEDYLGNRIISWDMGKYMNHSEEANSLTTGYGFEIAIRDIEQGEEVTDDYRIFSTHHNTSSWKEDANEEIQIWPKSLIQSWDKKILAALPDAKKVTQPLKDFLDADIWNEITSPNLSQNYISVTHSLPLRYMNHLNSLVTQF